MRAMDMGRRVHLRRRNGGDESLDDAAILRVAYSRTLAAQTHQIAMKRRELCDSLLDMSDVCIEKEVNLRTRLLRRVQ